LKKRKGGKKPSRGQFHQHFTREFFVPKFVQSQTVSREKLPKRLSYEKGECKTLMKLTPGKGGRDRVRKMF